VVLERLPRGRVGQVAHVERRGAGLGADRRRALSRVRPDRLRQPVGGRGGRGAAERDGARREEAAGEAGPRVGAQLGG